MLCNKITSFWYEENQAVSAMRKVKPQYHYLQGNSGKVEKNYREQQKSAANSKCAKVFLEVSFFHFYNSIVFVIRTSQVHFPFKKLVSAFMFFTLAE